MFNQASFTSADSIDINMESILRTTATVCAYKSSKFQILIFASAV